MGQFNSRIQRIKNNDPELIRLCLNYIQIGGEEAQALAEALKINATLKKLYLYRNQIGNEGAQVIAEALKFNTGLKKLYLYGNQTDKQLLNGIKSYSLMKQFLSAKTKEKPVNLYNRNALA